MSLLTLYLFVGGTGLWISLRILGDERQQQRSRLEYENKVRLHRELTDLRQKGLL